MNQVGEQEKIEKKTVKPAPVVHETVQRDLSEVNGPEGGMLPESVSSKIQSMRGSGQKLSERSLAHYSSKFGRDMSDVHVHTDTASDTISRSLNARAFTIGSDVFLTKGINPDGGGRDAQTMTHELTHVVQQGGHASSGPLKLGAADTSQEHEAESTAMREFDPKLKAKDTIQRNAFSAVFKSVGKSVGSGVLNALGLDGFADAWSDFMAGDQKVKDAFLKLDEGKQHEFSVANERVKKLYGGELAALKKDAENKQKEYEKKQTKAEDDQRAAMWSAGGDKTYQELDEKPVNEAVDAYNKAYQEFQDKRKEALSILQEEDKSITQDDWDRYNAGKFKLIGATIWGGIAGGIAGLFEQDSERKKAAQARVRNEINTSIAHTFNNPEKKKFTAGRKHMVVKGSFSFEQVTLEQQTDELLGKAYEDIVHEDQMQNWMADKKLGKSKEQIIKEIKDDPSFYDTMQRIAVKMCKTVYDPRSNALDEADEKLAMTKTLREKYGCAMLCTKYDEIVAEIDHLSEERSQINSAIQDEIDEETMDRLNQLDVQVSLKNHEKAEIEPYHEDNNYKGTGKKIDDYVSEIREDLLKFVTSKIDENALGDALKAKLRDFVSSKVQAEKDSVEVLSNDPKALNRKKEQLVKKAWEKVVKDPELKKKFGTWIMFRKMVMQNFDSVLTESSQSGEDENDIVDAVLEGVSAMSAKKEGNK